MEVPAPYKNETFPSNPLFLLDCKNQRKDKIFAVRKSTDRSKCFVCGKVKTIDNTNRDSRFDNGFASRCKECYNRQYNGKRNNYPRCSVSECKDRVHWKSYGLTNFCLFHKKESKRLKKVVRDWVRSEKKHKPVKRKYNELKWASKEFSKWELFRKRHLRHLQVIVKKFVREMNLNSCRKCGKKIQNRGNYYDYCYNCFPKKAVTINYCKFCGVVVHPGYVRTCRDCQVLYKRERKRKVISAYKEYKNKIKISGCSVCGYKKCLEAIEFHHTGKKDIEISKIKSIRRLNLEMKNGLSLLCANCHREVHAGTLKL